MHVLPASLIAALGMALSYIPGTMAAVSGAKPEDSGLASGLVNTSYQVGSAFGLAAMVAIATATTTTHENSGTVQVVALNSGFQAAFLGAALVAVLGALIAFVWLRTPKSVPGETQTKREEERAHVR